MDYLKEFFFLKIYFSVLINENLPFQEWIDSRLMPYVDYFSVPLDKKNTGKRKKHSHQILVRIINSWSWNDYFTSELQS
jgi:hypothetical protein